MNWADWGGVCSKFFTQSNGAKVKPPPTQQTKLSFSTKGKASGKKEVEDAAEVEDEAPSGSARVKGEEEEGIEEEVVKEEKGKGCCWGYRKLMS